MATGGPVSVEATGIVGRSSKRAWGFHDGEPTRFFQGHRRSGSPGRRQQQRCRRRCASHCGRWGAASGRSVSRRRTHR